MGDGERRFLIESMKWMPRLAVKDAASSSTLYIDCVALAGVRSDSLDVGFLRLPRTRLPVESDPTFASGVMITAFAKDTNERTANIFVMTEANIMSGWMVSLTRV